MGPNAAALGNQGLLKASGESDAFIGQAEMWTWILPGNSGKCQFMCEPGVVGNPLHCYLHRLICLSQLINPQTLVMKP